MNGTGHRPVGSAGARYDAIQQDHDTLGAIMPPRALDPTKELADLFKLLSNAFRLRILHALYRSGELNVRALCDNLDESQSAVSHHLTLLRGAGLVRVRRDGKRSFYHLEGGPLQELLDAIFADLPKEKRRFRFENLLLTYSPAARS